MSAALRRWLFASTVLGLAARLLFALAAPIAPAKDAAEYHALAVRLAEGRGFVDDSGQPTAFRPPGWPFLLSLAYRVAGPDPAAGRALSALLGALLVPLAALLARRLAGEDGARLAAVLAAFYPPFLTSYFSPRSLLAEPALSTAAAAALLLGLAAGERDSPPLAFLSGIAAGAACLVKGTLLFLPALLAAQVALGGGPARRRALLVLAGGALALLPWGLRNQARLGAFVPVSTNGGISVWASFNPASRGLGNGPEEGYWAIAAEDRRLAERGLGEVERSRHFAARARAEIAARPGRAIRLVLRKGLLFLDPTLKDWSLEVPPARYNLAYALLLPLALLGAARGPRPGATWLLAGFALALTSVHVLLHADVRYRVTLEPVILVFAAAALTRIAARRAAVPMLLAWVLLNVGVSLRYPAVLALLRRLVALLGLSLPPGS